MNDLDFVTFRVAEADDLAAAHGDYRFEQKFNADGFQLGIGGVEIGHTHRKMPKTLAESRDFNRGCSAGVFHRHQFKRCTGAKIIAVP